MELGCCLHWFPSQIPDTHFPAIFLVSGGSNFKPGTAAGDDQFARVMMITYAVSVMFMIANVFIAALNEILSAATNRILIEMEDAVFDPVDYMLLNAKRGYWKIIDQIYGLTKSREEQTQPE